MQSLVKRIRRNWLTLGAVVIAAAAVILYSAREDPREALVTSYLEALHDGDIERAMTYVDPDSREPVGSDDSYLVEEALSSDWEITEVRSENTDLPMGNVSERSGLKTVSATISAHGVSVQGWFIVGTGESGDLAILNPYVLLAMPVRGYTGIAFNGYAPQDSPDGEGPESIALFPGSYWLFDGAPDQDHHALHDPFVVMPGLGPSSEQSSFEVGRQGRLARFLGEHLPESVLLNTVLNSSLTALVDGCVTSEDPAPTGCPFNAGENRTGSNPDIVRIDGVTYAVEQGEWEVDTYPEARFADVIGIAWDYGTDGWFTFSTSGQIYDYDEASGAVLDLVAYCPLDYSALGMAITPDGMIKFDSANGMGLVSERALDSGCVSEKPS